MQVSTATPNYCWAIAINSVYEQQHFKRDHIEVKFKKHNTQTEASFHQHLFVGIFEEYQTDFCNSTQSKLCLLGLCSSENEEIIAIDKHKCTNNFKKPFENIRLLQPTLQSSSNLNVFRVGLFERTTSVTIRSVRKPKICYKNETSPKLAGCLQSKVPGHCSEELNHGYHRLKVIYPAVYVEFKRFGDILDLRSLVVHRTNYFSRDFNRTSILCNFFTYL